MSFIIQNNTDGSVNFLNSGNTALTINANNSINVGSFTGGITADTGIINIGSGQLYKDASGNMGLGVMPSAWNTNYRAIQIGSGGGISGRTDSALEMQLLGNAFRNTSGGYTYATTNKASRFMIDGDGSFGWYQAPSGTAGNPITFTPAMTLDASGNLLFNSGYGSVAKAYGCRAWVNFNGTGTVAIRASGNVSSITDNGTGDYTVNFTTALPDANYAFTGTAGRGASNGDVMVSENIVNVRTSSSVRFGTLDGSGGNIDCQQVNVSIFR